jgi:hypothetical protein
MSPISRVKWQRPQHRSHYQIELQEHEEPILGSGFSRVWYHKHLAPLFIKPIHFRPGLHRHGLSLFPSSEKASPAGPMPEGADGSAYYKDSTSGTRGAGAFLRVSRRLPASTHWCRSDAGYTASLHEPGTLCLGCIHVRQDYWYVFGTYTGAGYVPHRLWVRQYKRHGVGTTSYSSGSRTYRVGGSALVAYRPAPGTQMHCRNGMVMWMMRRRSAGRHWPLLGKRGARNTL